MATAKNKKDTITEINALRENLTEAMRAKKADDVTSLFTEDTVMFMLSPPLQFKGDEGPGKKGIQDWFDTFESDKMGYEIRDLGITADESVAFCHSLIHIRGKRTDGTETDIWVRETLGLKKIEGQWKIAHQHQSVPMYMDGSGKAAIDLKP